ncbi:MAG: hypothetical protein J6U12_02095 [Candidatus Methanomethylophilaceae archaeon]|nr:hypothetical protein [Candidatus Methanomethylophilaceae archaeon]
MFTESQLSVIHSISKGNDSIPNISESEGLSTPQTYRVVKQLTDMGLVSKKDKIQLERVPLAASLAKALGSAPDIIHPLSGSGLDILAAMTGQMTVPEIVEEIGLDPSRTYSKMRELLDRSMVIKTGHRYSVNLRVWPEFGQLLADLRRYKEVSIEDVPISASVYHAGREETVFSCDRADGYIRTAFSRYGEYGIDFVPGKEYYSTSDREPDLDTVFLHSLYVISKSDDWRLKMFTLIFYCKYKERLSMPALPVVSEMLDVLAGKKVKGWVPLPEMKERAQMYGVDLK